MKQLYNLKTPLLFQSSLKLQQSDHDTSVGFNSSFGPKTKYCKFYSEEETALAYLIREIRLCGGLIDGFPMEELDYIVSTV